MKSSNEMVLELLSRRDSYEAEQKRKKRILVRTITPVCSFMLVALLGIGGWQMGIFGNKNYSNGSIFSGATKPETVEDALFAGIKDYYGPEDIKDGSIGDFGLGGIETEPESDLFVPARIVNTVLSESSAAKLYFDPALHDETKLTAEAAAEYFGVNLAALSIENEKYNPSEWVMTLIKDMSGKVKYDTAVFTFGENSNVYLEAGKIGAPYDSVYIYETETPSSFKAANGYISVIIGKTDNGRLIADFTSGGISYRVTMDSYESEEEFFDIIQAIIDLS